MKLLLVDRPPLPRTAFHRLRPGAKAGEAVFRASVLRRGELLDVRAGASTKNVVTNVFHVFGELLVLPPIQIGRGLLVVAGEAVRSELSGCHPGTGLSSNGRAGPVVVLFLDLSL